MLRCKMILLLCLMLTSQALGAPELRLPWTSGEEWKCTNGYGSGMHTNTHNAYYSLDFDKPGLAENGPDQPVLAAAAGNVIFAGLNDSYGYCVKIDHEDNYVTMYAHLRYNPTVSGYVEQGKQIGVMGGTGTNGQKAYNDHIHFMVYYEGDCLSSVSESKPEPMSSYTNFTAGQYYTSNNPSPSYSGSYVSQTPTDPSGILHLQPNEVVSCSFTFRNDGNVPWTGDGNRT